MNRRSLLALVVCCACFSPVLAIVEQVDRARDELIREPARVSPRSARLELQGASPLAAAARSFRVRQGGEWTFRRDPRTDRVGLVQGSGVAFIPGKGNDLDEQLLRGLDLRDGAAPNETLRGMAGEFLESQRDLVLPARGEIVLDQASSLSRDGGRLISFYYDWLVDGVKVEGARVFVRVNSGNITQFGSTLVGPIAALSEPSIASDEAVRRLLAYSGDTETARILDQPELLFQPEDGPAGTIDYRLVWRFTYRLDGRLETWEGRVDARSGHIVGFRDINKYARAVAGIYPRTVTDNEIVVPVPQLSVTTPSGVVVTDTAGWFAYDGGAVSSTLGGHWFDTDCQGCSNPAQPETSSDSGIGYLTFGTGGVDEVGNGLSTPADRNSFYHLTQVRRLGKKWLPGLGFFADTSFESNVNITSTCNAVYTGNAVNFFRSGGGCNNTGEIADVMQHEYGHGIDQHTQPGDGATGEATSDTVAMHMTHSPLIGPYFHTDGSPVRNLDSSTSSHGVISVDNAASICPVQGSLGPLGLEVHCEGEIYGQASWDLSMALVAKYGHHTGWRESERIFFNALPDAGGYLPNDGLPVYDAYINADDDDGNLANGTPNALEIFNAFDAHGMANDQVPASPVCSRPDQPSLTVTPECDRVDLSWEPVTGAAEYVLFRTEVLSDTAFFVLAELGPSETQFSDFEVAPGVDYHYTVMAVDGAGCESPIENPLAASLPDQAILSVTSVTADDEPMGNRSGFPDPGEQVDLVLLLENLGQLEATSVAGTVSSPSPGVTMLLDTSSWPDLAAGDAEPNGSALRFETDADVVSCGDLLSFELSPSDASGCEGQTSFFTVRLGELVDGEWICDDTPACFTEPTFAGLESATPGASCGEIDLAWLAAESHCINAEITYNVYRSTSPGFTPGPLTLVHQVSDSTSLTDFALEPGQTYYYVVRAYDSRSGEESNGVELSASATVTPDIGAPVFGGLQSGGPGPRCGEVVLSWQPAIESCSGPVMYDVYRSPDPFFTPGPDSLVATTLSTAFVDTSVEVEGEMTYLVRARDGAGNADPNDVRITLQSGAEPLVVYHTGFESSDFPPNEDGWSAVEPNDASEEGRWAWGDPSSTNYQPGNDATPGAGVNCWITGLGTQPSNGDVDDGTTTLLSRAYDMSSYSDPVVAYSRWFTNDRGNSPGDPTDSFRIEVSNDDGQNWTPLEEVGAGTPLAWVPVELDIPVSATGQMRFRFSAADLGEGSLVEAGIDEFELIDARAGCEDCGFPPAVSICRVDVGVLGDDVVIDWSDTPISDFQVVIYDVKSCDERIKIGTVDGGTSFVHVNAALSQESYNYRVTYVDACGDERPFCGTTDCP